MFTIWNTKTRAREPFAPYHAPRVGIYSCGPTVYNPLTIGNWRTFIFDDVLVRTLRFFGYDVTWVMNVTDVGHLVGDGDEGMDKVANEATKRGMTSWELARQLEAEFVAAMERFHIQRPDKLPRATEHIAEQIALVQDLERKGFAYQTSDGIYFDTAKFPSYGSLSGQNLADKEAGARVAINPEKRNASDFALWKFSPTTGAKRDMEWESPWGIGFPGWHIECSAMSTQYLGQPFDIHTGGIDLIPVHHENEIAQSEAAHDAPLARYWMHGEFLLINGGRMGKSLGNAYTIEDIISHGYDPVVYRYYTLGAHYRSKLNFTWDGMEAASQALHKLHAAARRMRLEGPVSTGFMDRFTHALEDDLNIPQALAVVWELIKSDEDPAVQGATLVRMDAVLGLGFQEAIERAQTERALVPPADILALAETRQTARQEKRWDESDVLRQQLRSLGWDIQDEKEGGYTLSRI